MKKDPISIRVFDDKEVRVGDTVIFVSFRKSLHRGVVKRIMKKLVEITPDEKDHSAYAGWSPQVHKDSIIFEKHGDTARNLL